MESGSGLEDRGRKNLTRTDLETLAGGISGYPPGRAGAAKDEILRRDRKYAEKQEQSRLWWPKLGAWAAIVSAVASIIAACEGLFKVTSSFAAAALANCS
jgi:hypothetical protein